MLSYTDITTDEMLDLLEGSECITISVGLGDRAKIWHLPKSFLTHLSPFFDRALDGSFAEARTKFMMLREDEPQTFKLFVKWLFIGTEDSLCEDPDEAVRAWFFGENITCPNFQNSAILDIIKCHEAFWITSRILRLAYDRFFPGSKLPQCAIPQLRWDARKGALAHHRDEFISWAEGMEDIGLDFMKSYLDTDHNKIKDPAEDTRPHMVGQIENEETCRRNLSCQSVGNE